LTGSGFKSPASRWRNEFALALPPEENALYHSEAGLFRFFAKQEIQGIKSWQNN
jgi:hypothetical protein